MKYRYLLFGLVVLFILYIIIYIVINNVIGKTAIFTKGSYNVQNTSGSGKYSDGREFNTSGSVDYSEERDFNTSGSVDYSDGREFNTSGSVDYSEERDFNTSGSVDYSEEKDFNTCKYCVNHRKYHPILKPHLCNSCHYDLVLLITSSQRPGAKERRHAIRQSWGNDSYYLPRKVTHLFLLGKFSHCSNITSSEIKA